MKILLVDDDEFVAEVIRAVITNQNYVVEVACDGQAAWDLIEGFNYDLILLDVILPKIDGISLCRKIRSAGLMTPILLLTGCDSSHEKAIGLDAGADDYLVKPFDQEELIARMRALLRRGSVASPTVLTWGNLRLDPTTIEVTYLEQPLSLTPKEHALLELFLRNSRRVFSCGMILEHLWSYDDTPGEEAVRTHIKGLRMKLRRVGLPGNLIETVYGIGYRLKSPKEEVRENSLVGNELTPIKTQDVTAEVWKRFQGRIDEQVSILEQAKVAASENNLKDKLHQQALQQAHSLAGSLGTFGFALGSKLAREIEHLLKTNRTLTHAEITQFDLCVKRLREEIEINQADAASSPKEDKKLHPQGDGVFGHREWGMGHGEEGQVPQAVGQLSLWTQEGMEFPSKEDEYPLLLVVDSDRLFAEQIAKSAANSLRVVIATNIETAFNQIEREYPSVVLLDPSVSPLHEDSLHLLSKLKDKHPIPIIIFTSDKDFSHRVQLARHGGHTFLEKPLSVSRVLQAVMQVLPCSPHAEYHLLAVDDDPKIGALLQVLLTPWGIKVTTLDEPRRFWETLESVQPNLLILDVEMPDISGIEICQIIRNDCHWSELPILFLTVHNDANMVNQVFAVGADDFVSKPIVGEELVTRIINRLERMKLRQGITQSRQVAV